MTQEEWEKQAENCNSEAEMNYLLRNRPKKVITTGAPCPVIPNSDRGLPLLDKLMQGKK